MKGASLSIESVGLSESTFPRVIQMKRKTPKATKGTVRISRRVQKKVRAWYDWVYPM